MSFLQPKPATSSSENSNNDLIKSTYGGSMGAGTGATNFLLQLLGVSPSGVANTAAGIGTAADGIATAGGAQAGYNNYLQNAGYAPAMKAMTTGTVGSGAAAGILNSGTTAKALQSSGAALNQSYFNNYLQNLSGLAGQGLQAGGLVANAGQKSSSTGGSPSALGGIASTVGGIAGIFSDRRLKCDIEKIREEPDGLGIYSFRYIGQAAKLVGVMAQDVARLRPWALGPVKAGFATVNYGAL